METARKILEEQSYTCVLVSEEQQFTSRDRGVKPLLLWLEKKEDFTGFSAADKVVGKGAAMLYVLLKVKEVYAKVISKSACDTLENAGIRVTYETLVERIRNRTGDGFCPVEEVVLKLQDPVEGLQAIKNRLKTL